MAKTLLLVPVGTGAALTAVSLGLVHALQRQGLDLGFSKPISPAADPAADRTIAVLNSVVPGALPCPLALAVAKDLDPADFEAALFSRLPGNQLCVVAGVPHEPALNILLAQRLNAKVILLAARDGTSTQQLAQVLAQCEAALGQGSVEGLILNHKLSPRTLGRSALGPGQGPDTLEALPAALRLLADIPWRGDLIAPRVWDLAQHLNALPLCSGDWQSRRLNHLLTPTQPLQEWVGKLCHGTLVVTPGDSSDVIVATCLAAQNGVRLGGLLLTGGIQPQPAIMALCEDAFDAGLPLLMVDSDDSQTLAAIRELDLSLPADDDYRQRWIMDQVAEHLDSSWLSQFTPPPASALLSPPAFAYQLQQRAKAAAKRIILPEGDEPRVIKAAAHCTERGIAQCVLLGKPEQVQAVARHHGLTLPARLAIIDPDAVRERYVGPMVALRRQKGLEEVMAREQLQDNVVLATMMLAQGEVDGLVSGARGTTLQTLRPPMQLIKTAPGQSMVSSVFFMLLPDQVLIYGDCAINPNPDAYQLAQIALQCADSAERLGIAPHITMIADNQGGTGASKVEHARQLLAELKPELVVDGPLHYDAAVIESVARAKAPGSPVAGQANIFVFPDLNTGYSTYQAVRRSADLVTLGPMVQGFAKPVNDLSRDAKVTDVIQTIALTAIQAELPH